MSFANSITLGDFIRKYGNRQYINGTYVHDYNKSVFTYYMYGILFQVYAALYPLHKHFTHGDLHTENVLLVSHTKFDPNSILEETFDDKIYHFNYKISKHNDSVHFFCPYKIKIIDFGN